MEKPGEVNRGEAPPVVKPPVNSYFLSSRASADGTASSIAKAPNPIGFSTQRGRFELPTGRWSAAYIEGDPAFTGFSRHPVMIRLTVE